MCLIGLYGSEDLSWEKKQYWDIFKIFVFMKELERYKQPTQTPYSQKLLALYGIQMLCSWCVLIL